MDTLLFGKCHFTVGELAEEFSVSRRTILRDLQALEQAGFPLYSEVGAAGGYHILKERVLPPIAFSESEAKALFLRVNPCSTIEICPLKKKPILPSKNF